MSSRQSARQSNPDVCAPPIPVRRVGASAVRLRDDPDDRETQTGATASAGLVTTSETLERLPEKLRWEPIPFVLHMKLDKPVGGRRR